MSLFFCATGELRQFEKSHNCNINDVMQYRCADLCTRLVAHIILDSLEKLSNYNVLVLLYEGCVVWHLSCCIQKPKCFGGKSCLQKKHEHC